MVEKYCKNRRDANLPAQSAECRAQQPRSQQEGPQAVHVRPDTEAQDLEGERGPDGGRRDRLEDGRGARCGVGYNQRPGPAVHRALLRSRRRHRRIQAHGDRRCAPRQNRCPLRPLLTLPTPRTEDELRAVPRTQEARATRTSP